MENENKHGAEAEALRVALEMPIEGIYHDGYAWQEKVQEILDRVDAGDSLAFLNTQSKRAEAAEAEIAVMRRRITKLANEGWAWSDEIRALAGKEG